ncbi:MAG: chloramphenicol phosphotransferase [Alphaproteobacteria bacterium]|nr:chloramphenicol phosphotransferase [Alphaproteobacteria bacterium]
MSRSVDIILLDGVGSAGKTSIARALQAITREVFLHVQMDTFLDMMPPACIGHPDGFIFETLPTIPPEVAIRTGPSGHRAMAGMRHAVRALADQGNHLIVDDVLTTPDQHASYATLLSDHRLHRVAVRAPLDVLEAREAGRGDRLIGLARWQFPRVHQGANYDLSVDTSEATPEECARTIRTAFGI